MDRAAIPGSEPDHAGYRREGAADPGAQLRATIVLRPRDYAVATALLSGKYDSSMPASPGGDKDDKAAVEAFARANGLAIEKSDEAARTVVVSGSATQMGQAFGVILGQFASPDGGVHLSYDGNITLPAQLAPNVLAVLGLDTRPVARPR